MRPKRAEAETPEGAQTGPTRPTAVATRSDDNYDLVTRTEECCLPVGAYNFYAFMDAGDGTRSNPYPSSTYQVFGDECGFTLSGERSARDAFNDDGPSEVLAVVKTSPKPAGVKTCCVTVEVHMPRHSNVEEIGWELSGTSCSAAPGSIESSTHVTYECCLEAGDYNFVATDTAGDGWGESWYTITGCSE